MFTLSESVGPLSPSPVASKRNCVCTSSFRVVDEPAGVFPAADRHMACDLDYDGPPSAPSRNRYERRVLGRSRHYAIPSDPVGARTPPAVQPWVSVPALTCDAEMSVWGCLAEFLCVHTSTDIVSGECRPRAAGLRCSPGADGCATTSLTHPSSAVALLDLPGTCWLRRSDS